MLALVTATKNSIETIERAVVSVQPIADRIVHIVIDGGSVDGTRQYLESLAAGNSSISVHVQRQRGLYEALNEGIEIALGDPRVTHIGLLHSDDYLLTETYREYLDSIEGDDAEVFYSDIEFHNSSGRVVRIWQSGSFSLVRLRTGWMPPHTSMVVSRTVYESVGAYRPDFGTAADYDWIVRVFLTGRFRIGYFSKRTLSMLVGGASGASLKARLRANAMDGSVWAGESRLQSLVVRVCKPARKVGQFLVARR